MLHLSSYSWLYPILFDVQPPRQRGLPHAIARQLPRCCSCATAPAPAGRREDAAERFRQGDDMVVSLLNRWDFPL